MSTMYARITPHPDNTKVVNHDEWLKARLSLLEKEKEHTRAGDALAAQRRDLPMLLLNKTYAFTGPSGKLNLSDMFDGRKQLIIYHFMLGPDAKAGCQGCCFMADNFPNVLAHLNSRGTTLALVSRAPYEQIAKFKERMGWAFPWYSSNGSDFNYDFHVSLDESVAPVEYNYKEFAGKGEMPGLSVFVKCPDGTTVLHTYSAYGRGMDHLLVTYGLLDLTPYGRQDGPDGPGEFKLHDAYTDEDIGKKEKH